MKVVFSGLVSHMTGSFGGASIRKYKQGFSMYPKVVEAKRNTSNQSITRARFARICSAWNALLPAEINEWNARRIFFGYVDISTFNFFVLVQTPLLNYLDEIDTVGNLQLLIPSIVLVDFEINSPNLFITVEVDVYNDDSAVLFYVQEISNGITSVFFDRIPLYSKVITAGDSVSEHFSLNSSIFKVGKRYAIRIIWLSSGSLKSQPYDYILQL